MRVSGPRFVTRARVGLIVAASAALSGCQDNLQETLFEIRDALAIVGDAFQEPWEDEYVVSCPGEYGGERVSVTSSGAGQDEQYYFATKVFVRTSDCKDSAVGGSTDFGGTLVLRPGDGAEDYGWSFEGYDDGCFFYLSGAFDASSDEPSTALSGEVCGSALSDAQLLAFATVDLTNVLPPRVSDPE